MATLGSGRLTRAIGGAVLLACLCGAGRATQQTEVEVELAAARRSLVEGERDEALADFDRIAKEHPDDGGTWLRISVFLVFEQEEYEAGEPFARRSMELLPDLTQAYAPLFHILYATRRAPEYETLARAALERLPDDARMLVHLGIALLQGRKHVEAQVWLEKALELSPRDAFAHFTAGTNCIELRRYEDAERFFRNCLVLEPTHPDAPWQLAQVLAYQDRNQEAEALFRKAAAKGNRDAAFSYGVFLFQQERPAEALPYFKRLVERRPRDRMAWKYLAQSYHALRRAAAAREAMERFRELQTEKEQSEDEFLLRLLRERNRMDVVEDEEKLSDDGAP